MVRQLRQRRLRWLRVRQTEAKTAADALAADQPHRGRGSPNPPCARSPPEAASANVRDLFGARLPELHLQEAFVLCHVMPRNHSTAGEFRSVEVERVEEERVIRAVSYVRDPSVPAGESGYFPLTPLEQKKAVARTTLAAELSRIEAAIRRARDAASFLERGAELEALLKQVITIKDGIN
jgi:hypothetical protein